MRPAAADVIDNSVAMCMYVCACVLRVVRACLCVDGIDACGCVAWLLLGGKRDRLAGRTMDEAGRPPMLLIPQSLCAHMRARACYNWYK